MKTKLYLILFCFVFWETVTFADTIYLLDGRELKGIVVEDYKDRIVISTYEGEKTVLKKNIDKILYDLKEQNLVRLGDRFMSKRDYGKAYFYYEKAYRANPDYNLAREKMNYVTGYLYRKKRQEKLEDVKRVEALEGRKIPAPTQEDFGEILREELGLGISLEKNRIRVKDILKDSPASLAGLKENDILISVWGKLTGYMPENEVASLLVEESAGEIKMVAERDIVLKKELLPAEYRDVIGGKLDMLFDGLTIVDLEKTGPGQKAGLEKDDLIVAINGAPTRYMPVEDALKRIEDKSSETLVFTVRRNMTIWRK